MKQSLVLAFALGADAVIQIQKDVKKVNVTPLRKHKASLLATLFHLPDNVNEEEPPSTGDAVFFGDTRCPCIGFDNIGGQTMVELPIEDSTGKVETRVAAYPADLGARCEAWDQGRHPSCTGPEKDRPSWCGNNWCIVDSCKCDIDVLPKRSIYMPTATYIGKPLFWSYHTCGSKDLWSDPKLVPKLGLPKCRCVGFADVPGNTEVAFKNDEVGSYPGDMGSKCVPWDEHHHPDCKGKGKDAPSWCRARWCYVDPCGCELPNGEVPKISAYLPEATFTGKSLYYSYETCKSEDTWTAKHHKHACVNQETKRDCRSSGRCAWTGDRCVGWEILNHPLCQAERNETVAAAKDKKDEKSGSSSLASSCFALAAAFAITALA